MRRVMCGTCGSIAFIRARDGEEAAQEYAKRTAQAYRRAVRQVRGRIMRPEMIRAYKVAKQAITPRTKA